MSNVEAAVVGISARDESVAGSAWSQVGALYHRAHDGQAERATTGLYFQFFLLFE